ncbi:DUF397 domain-containing protein [Streptomyces sp. NPDC057877]|uniref:DUF397 domain-containing protein n=1 Tax=Streptomyces sp. NPDC057877 TaxID=3346269 RepID=UPI0036A3AE1E
MRYSTAWNSARSHPPAHSTSSTAYSKKPEKVPVPTIHWQRSSYSGDGSNCVEIATASTTIHIRDSKHPQGPHLGITRTTWTPFIQYVTSDLLAPR